MVRVETLTTPRQVPLKAIISGAVAIPVVVLAVGIGFSVRHVPAAGGSLTVSLGSQSTFINPLLASTDTDSAISAAVFSPLLTQSPTGSLAPGLAQSWHVSNGGRTYTFQLRPGLTWSNGKPVTAYDAAYTFRLLTSPGFTTYSSDWAGARISTPATHTLVVRLPRPDFTFAQNATVGIVPNNYVQDRWPVGAGPFTVSTVATNGINLNARPQFATGAPYLSGIQFLRSAGPAPKTALTCRPSFGASTTATLIPTTQLLGLAMNMQTLPARPVRRALISALLFNTQSTLIRLSSPTPTWPLGPVRLTRSGFRPAAQIMQSAGWHLRSGFWWKKGHELVIRLAASSDPTQNQVVNALSRAWFQAGFRVSVVRDPFPILVRTVLYPGMFEAAMVDWDFGSPDYKPGDFWSGGAALNFGHLNDPLVNRLAVQVPASASPTTRDYLRTQIGNQIVLDGAGLGIAQESYSCRIPTLLHGYTPPTLVTDAGGLMIGLPQWYENTKLALKNPL